MYIRIQLIAIRSSPGYEKEIDGNAIVQVYNTLGQSVFAKTVPIENVEMKNELWLHNSNRAG
ncbi:MAG: hypothetical protein WBB36_04310, partial [Chitinophagales bacterium]